MAEETDFSKAIEQVKAMLSSDEGESQIQGIIEMLSGGQKQGSDGDSGDDEQDASQTAANSAADIFSGIGDIENIMKIKNILGAVKSQRNDSNAAFLQALKPFLSKSRQAKVDNAAKILKATQAIKLFKDSGLGGV